MFSTPLTDKVREFAEDILTNKIPHQLVYHDLQHTREVIEAIEEIGRNSELSDEDMETVVVAAWLHDTGYSVSCENHEEESALIASKFLNELGMDPHRIKHVMDIIKSTKMPQSPKNLLEYVMCDADLYHLSTDQFMKKGDLLHSELEYLDEKIPKKEWLKKNIAFFSGHQYFTNYAKVKLEPRKRDNIKQLKKLDKDKVDGKYVKKLEDQVVKLQNKLDRNKIIRPDRGIETMFRVTSKNHITLSGMADNKANIMISINSIILSVLVSVLFRKLEEYPQLMIPTVILVGVCLTTIVFAILATRPNVSPGKFDREDIKNQSTNLLFFGNFHSMTLGDYEWGMKETMKDADFLYGSMIRDIYFLGKVLGKKYKMLRISYTIFMFGFVFSILTFLIAMIVYPAVPA